MTSAFIYNKVQFYTIQRIFGKLEIFTNVTECKKEKEKENSISPISIKMGDQWWETPGRNIRMSTFGMPNEGGARNRREDKGGGPMSISGKEYPLRNNRAQTHFAATSEQWANAGSELMTLTALISYTYGNESQ